MSECSIGERRMFFFGKGLHVPRIRQRYKPTNRQSDSEGSANGTILWHGTGGGRRLRVLSGTLPKRRTDVVVRQ